MFRMLIDLNDRMFSSQRRSFYILFIQVAIKPALCRGKLIVGSIAFTPRDLTIVF